MTAVSDDHRLQWVPPGRPEWVRRINEEGSCMDIRGVVPLDEKSLLDTATRNTGLSDFGDDDWREPFRIFVQSLEKEAELNLIGRLRTRSEILQLLESRLQIEQAYKRHPEIDDEQIRQPLFILGQGRSGTSFLLNVLSHDPDNGSAKWWEVMFPSPPPEKSTYKTDSRIEKGHKLLDQWVRVTPELAGMHEFDGNLAFECCQIMALNFTAPSFLDALGQVPSYDEYVYQKDMEPAIRYHKRLLKLLQWKNPRRHWVLKDNMHIDRLPLLLKIYPDALFVWPHRDPVRALASTVNLIGTVQWGRCDQPFKAASWAYVTEPEFAARRFNAAIDTLQSGVVPKQQICHLLYKDLVSDTMGTLGQMYRQLGIPLTDEGRRGMEKYLREHPRDARPPNKYNMGSPEAMQRARSAFKRYQDYFNVPSE
jgi:Sulfotransferase family